jgi:hypothetical protein
VPWKEFLASVERYAPDVDVMIERESGDARVADAAAARALVAEYSGVPVGAGA